MDDLSCHLMDNPYYRRASELVDSLSNEGKNLHDMFCINSSMNYILRRRAGEEGYESRMIDYRRQTDRQIAEMRENLNLGSD